MYLTRLLGPASRVRDVGVRDLGTALELMGGDRFDARAHDSVLDPAQGLKLVDYERCHRDRADPSPLQRSCVPADFDGVVPLAELHGSVSAQWPWRAAHVLHRDLTGDDGRARRAARAGRLHPQRGRRALGQRCRVRAHRSASGAGGQP